MTAAATPRLLRATADHLRIPEVAAVVVDALWTSYENGRIGEMALVDITRALHHAAGTRAALKGSELAPLTGTVPSQASEG